METITTGLAFSIGGIVTGTMLNMIPSVRSIAEQLWPRPNIVYIGASDCWAAYSKLETYIISKFAANIQACQLQTKHGSVACSLDDAAFSDYIMDEYAGQQVRLQIVSDRSGRTWQRVVENYVSMFTPLRGTGGGSSSGTNNAPIITVSSWHLTVDQLRSYVNTICTCKPDAGKTTMYVIKERKNQHETHLEWEELHVRTNKRLTNTVVSRKVERELLDDVRDFMASECEYNAAGIPYTKGYMLYGAPGTGKSSLIKAIAAEYNLPVFIIDFDIVTTNAQLNKIVKEMHEHTAGEPFILAMEDLDRSTMFAHRSSIDTITAQALLNCIDGLVESHGRILFITANDPDIIRRKISQGALMRPGRIDAEVEIGMCDFYQVQRLLFHYYGLEHACIQTLQQENLIENVSPAMVQQLFQRYGGHGRNDPRLVIARLFRNTAAVVVGQEQEQPSAAEQEVLKEMAMQLQSKKEEELRRKLEASEKRGRRLKTTLRQIRERVRRKSDVYENREAHWMLLGAELVKVKQAAERAEATAQGWKRRNDTLKRKLADFLRAPQPRPPKTKKQRSS